MERVLRQEQEMLIYAAIPDHPLGRRVAVTVTTLSRFLGQLNL